MMYRQWNKPNAASDAIANAIADLDPLGEESAEHPLVIRTRRAIDEFENEYLQPAN